MRSSKIVFITTLSLAAVIFGIQNTGVYTLSFLDYAFAWPLPLWALLLVFFIGGMLPLWLSGIPEKLGFFARLRALRKQQRRLEKETLANESRLSAS